MLLHTLRYQPQRPDPSYLSPTYTVKCRVCGAGVYGGMLVAACSLLPRTNPSKGRVQGHLPTSGRACVVWGPLLKLGGHLEAVGRIAL